MKFELIEESGRAVCPESITSYELVSELDAACDGLRLRFLNKSVIECSRVKAYDDGGNLVFSGIADRQEGSYENGIKSSFVYARSTAAVLVDNEAYPCNYYNPSAEMLCNLNAGGFGFSCRLPAISSEEVYCVSKGTSCFGAVNEYVRAKTGRGIYVNPENEICIFPGEERLRSINDMDVISLKSVINRSEVISRIDYKNNCGDKYNSHFESKTAAGRGIMRRRLVNISALPGWQRAANLENRLKDSLSKLYMAEIVVAGSADIRLYDRMLLNLPELQLCGEYYVCRIVRRKNKNGEAICISLSKKFDGELINYVAEQAV